MWPQVQRLLKLPMWLVIVQCASPRRLPRLPRGLVIFQRAGRTTVFTIHPDIRMGRQVRLQRQVGWWGESESLACV